MPKITLGITGLKNPIGDPPLSCLVLPAQLRLACEQALQLGEFEKSRESSTRRETLVLHYQAKL